MVTATLQAGVDATFSKTLEGVSAGVTTFSIFGEDTEGRKSITLNLTISVTANLTTTISGIFLPPTIDTPAKINKGDALPIRGQTFPQSTISISVTSEEVVKGTVADAVGGWRHDFDTGVLAVGTHLARAKAVSLDGEQSVFSEVKAITVLSPTALLCSDADLNGDGRVNLIDFSIMMFWWQRDNVCADLNQDGIVNIIDFSILLFYWTG